MIEDVSATRALRPTKLSKIAFICEIDETSLLVTITFYHCEHIWILNEI